MSGSILFWKTKNKLAKVTVQLNSLKNLKKKRYDDYLTSEKFRKTKKAKNLYWKKIFFLLIWKPKEKFIDKI